jgi:putative pyruvate formate lyase activating enzyme
MRVLDDGRLEIVDPDLETLALIRTLDPAYRVRRAPLECFTRPRLLGSRERGSGVAIAELQELATEALWAAHDAARAPGSDLDAGLHNGHRRVARDGEATVLDVACELAVRLSRRCSLCAHRCGVDRASGELGRCRLGPEAFVYEAYTHIAEEPPINPALNISLRGCGMRCRSCQQFRALGPRGRPQERLEPAFWERLDLGGARSLTFVGGNPTENLPAVLSFLRAAPSGLHLPVGWNCSGFDAVEAIRLLDGVCDFYVPDFKFGNDDCAERLAGAPGYLHNAEAVVAEMCRQGVPVFVRILVLPGHVECCHVPALERLTPLRGRLRLNVLGQYAPDFLIREADGPLAGRVRAGEVAAVNDAAVTRGFTFVDDKEVTP